MTAAARLISIIGAVGAGKTTLAELLSRQLDAVCIREDYAKNPFLAESYMGNSELDLPSQLYFLTSRATQLNLTGWPESGLYVSDYGFSQDRIFAEWKLRGHDLETYDFIAGKMARFVKQPDFMIHLDVDVEVLYNRIAARGRNYESVFTREFLEYLRQKQFDIEVPENCGFLRLDATAGDFRKPQVLAGIVDVIRAYRG
ncbi:MAG TPA: deoxynucleoside kinase [Phycisphaerae bacterium]|nr:deoxynucleoside kinase [Phycisphaerae bacterium]HPS52750.1 deoxynucleoside kinase [Phycisphaerae bacterium]